MRCLYLTFFLFQLIFFPAYSNAVENDAYRASGLKIPRFVSIAKNEANVRSGPGTQYPVKWIITKKLIPVEVILEFDNWRKIRDFDGQEGWVFHTLLSGKRSAIVATQNEIFALKDPKGNPEQPKAKDIVMRLQPRAAVNIMSCHDIWCRINAKGYSGWIKRKSLWGVYETEKID